MHAVVLVGGFGTRLRPLTYTVPKPMLPVCNRPIIEHLLANLARAGVTEATLALGFRPEPFVDAFPDGECAGIRLHYAVEPEPLDTAGAIRFAAEWSGIDDTFIVANGDILTDLDVAELVAHHRACGGEATIHLIPVADPSAFGVVATDDESRVLAFVEKPAPGTEPSNFINAGTYVFEPSVLGRIEPGRKVSVERVVFPAMVADGALFALARDVYWVDTGRPELYLQANLDLLDGTRGTPQVGIDAGARIAHDAVVEQSCVAAGASVGAGATLRDSVVLAGGRIGEGAQVTRSSVAGTVGRGAIVVDCVIGAEGIIADGEETSGVRRPSEA